MSKSLFSFGRMSLFMLIFVAFLLSCGDNGGGGGAGITSPSGNSDTQKPDDNTDSNPDDNPSNTEDKDPNKNPDPENPDLINSKPLLEEPQMSGYIFILNSSIEDVFISNKGGEIDICSISPRPPAGLSITKYEGSESIGGCILSGTPETVQDFKKYWISASNDFGAHDLLLEIKILDNKPAISADENTYVFYQNTSIETIIFKNDGAEADTCSSSPILFAGLTVQKDNSGKGCMISGTPTETNMETSFTITAKNNNGEGNAVISIEVKSNEIAPDLNSKSYIKVYNLNEPIEELVFPNVGGPADLCSVSPDLPEGLNLVTDLGKCKLSGTPTATEDGTTFTISASNAKGDSPNNANLILTVRDPNAAPLLTSDSTPLTYIQKTSSGIYTFENKGGDIEDCEVNPELPGGFTLRLIAGFCELIIDRPPETRNEDTFIFKAINSKGFSESTRKISVNSPPPRAPKFKDGYFDLTLYKDMEMVPYILINSGDDATSCSQSDLPSGLGVDVFNGSCRVTGAPQNLTDGDETISAIITGTNDVGSHELTLRFKIKSPDEKPYLSPVGNPGSLIKNKKMNRYLFANLGGPVEECVVSPELPAGLNLIYYNGTCGIEGVPKEVKELTQFSFEPTNQYGSMDWKPFVSLAVIDPSDETAEEYINPTINYIEGSNSAFQPNTAINVEAGKYWGTAYGRYLTLFIYGPYPEESPTPNLNSDSKLAISQLTDNFNIGVGEWFHTFSFSLSKVGFYRLYAAFCVNSYGSLSDPLTCKYIEDNAKNIGIGTASSGGSSSTSRTPVTDESIQEIVDELQSKTSEELAALETEKRSTRLEEAIKNLETRSAGVIENDLGNLLNDSINISDGSLAEFSNTRRIIEIFVERYDSLKNKLNFGPADTDYKKARLAWEWLFPMRNGHIISKPDEYAPEVARGEKLPYTFKNFLMASSLYVNYCGDVVPLGHDNSEPRLKELCKRSLAEAFTHFAQEVGGHIGDHSSDYKAPVNGTLVTAAKSVPGAGGMREYKCTEADGLPNQYGLILCPENEIIPEWRQAFYYVNESGCSTLSDGCDYRECTPGTFQGDAWPCPDGQKYFGRGAKQLSYNYNYGPFSDVIFGTINTLLQNPGRVTEGWLSIASATYFFMQPRPPKPSMFERIYGFWTLPEGLEGKHKNLEAGNLSGSIMIINGGVECGGTAIVSQAANRAKFYMGFMDFFGFHEDFSTTEQNADTMTCANTPKFDSIHGASYDTYWVNKSWIGGCYLVPYETAYSGFIPGHYEKCIRSIE